ncbi:MAG: hypothetical protein QM703_22625 [Gemmatales bacterium]
MPELREDILEARTGLHRVFFTEVRGGYELTASWHLVQAVGDLNEIGFYFRAKHGEWKFETQDKQGHVFHNEHPNHFVRRGMYDQMKPNAMTIEWSSRILRKCLGEYWDRLK